MVFAGQICPVGRMLPPPALGHEIFDESEKIETILMQSKRVEFGNWETINTSYNGPDGEMNNLAINAFVKRL